MYLTRRVNVGGVGDWKLPLDKTCENPLKYNPRAIYPEFIEGKDSGFLEQYGQKYIAKG